MKKASEYLQDELSKLDDIDQPWLDYNVYDGRATPIFEAIKQAQKDAVEYALEQAAEKAEVRIKYDSVKSGEIDGYSDDRIWIRDQDGSGCNLYTDKQSILSLKDKLFKELDNDTK